MPYKLGAASRENLAYTKPEIQRVVNLAITMAECDFSVVEGLRTEKRQKELMMAGVSWTMHSKHLTGDAVDIYPWADGKTCHKAASYKLVARAMFAAAIELGVDIEWGGFWILPGGNEDKPHWELK